MAARHDIYQNACERDKQIFHALDSDPPQQQDAYEMWYDCYVRNSLEQAFYIGRTDEDPAEAARNEFRRSLMEASIPKSNERLWFCPILSQWCAEKEMQAVHLFPTGGTQDTMTRIFGTAEELHSTSNGLYIQWVVAFLLDIGELTIVPDVEGPTGKNTFIRTFPQNFEVKMY